MKHSKNILGTLLIVFLISSLSFGQVSYDLDKTLDFTKFKTFTFKGWEKDSDQQLNDLDKKRITDAFAHELEIRGFTKDDNSPDVAITLYIVVEEKSSTTAYTNYNGGMGYGMGAGAGWGMGYGGAGMGSSTTSYSTNDYQVGTIVIDFYDASTKKLAWQGTMKATIKKPKKRDKSIPRSVAKLMLKYPVKASK